MRGEGLRAHVGYRKPRHHSGESHIAVCTVFVVNSALAAPDDAWVTDITYVRTHEGWLYLAEAVDLFSRKVTGWSMYQCITALNALLMAV